MKFGDIQKEEDKSNERKIDKHTSQIAEESKINQELRKAIRERIRQNILSNNPAFIKALRLLLKSSEE
ncbi:MAG: hypothetical protein N2517_02335 [Ignavibacteria bacterium]|nr:hypothetical protein [Ignavibacteria bacterium]